MECVLLAGGMGTRLRSVVSDLPKCMAPVAGRPFLAWLFDDLLEAGFEHIILSLGYLHETVEAWLRNSLSATASRVSWSQSPWARAAA